jgi:hypothetical protein
MPSSSRSTTTTISPPSRSCFDARLEAAHQAPWLWATLVPLGLALFTLLFTAATYTSQPGRR